jgi:hypothetical protein
MNETSSVSCNTVPFVTQSVLFGGWRLGRQSPMADVNILILNGLKSLLVQPTVFRSSTGGDARPRLFVWVSSPECSVQGAVLDGLSDVLEFDCFSSFQVGNRSCDFEDAVMSSGSQALLGHRAF